MSNSTNTVTVVDEQSATDDAEVSAIIARNDTISETNTEETVVNVVDVSRDEVGLAALRCDETMEDEDESSAQPASSAQNIILRSVVLPPNAAPVAREDPKVINLPMGFYLNRPQSSVIGQQQQQVMPSANVHHRIIQRPKSATLTQDRAKCDSGNSLESGASSTMTNGGMTKSAYGLSSNGSASAYQASVIVSHSQPSQPTPGTPHGTPHEAHLQRTPGPSPRPSILRKRASDMQGTPTAARKLAFGGKESPAMGLFDRPSSSLGHRGVESPCTEDNNSNDASSSNSGSKHSEQHPPGSAPQPLLDTPRKRMRKQQFEQTGSVDEVTPTYVQPHEASLSGLVSSHSKHHRQTNLQQEGVSNRPSGFLRHYSALTHNQQSPQSIKGDEFQSDEDDEYSDEEESLEMGDQKRATGSRKRTAVRDESMSPPPRFVHLDETVIDGRKTRLRETNGGPFLCSRVTNLDAVRNKPFQFDEPLPNDIEENDAAANEIKGPVYRLRPRMLADYSVPWDPRKSHFKRPEQLRLKTKSDDSNGMVATSSLLCSFTPSTTAIGSGRGVRKAQTTDTGSGGTAINGQSRTNDGSPTAVLTRFASNTSAMQQRLSLWRLQLLDKQLESVCNAESDNAHRVDKWIQRFKDVVAPDTTIPEKVVSTVVEMALSFSQRNKVLNEDVAICRSLVSQIRDHHGTKVLRVLRRYSSGGAPTVGGGRRGRHMKPRDESAAYRNNL